MTPLPLTGSLDPVSAVATAVTAIASLAKPIVDQQVAQAYQNALTKRIKACQSVLDQAGTPAFPTAADFLFNELCNDAQVIRPPGVSTDPLVSIRVADLAILFAFPCYLIYERELNAAMEAKS